MLRSFVQLTHPPTASRGSTSSLEFNWLLPEKTALQNLGGGGRKSGSSDVSACGVREMLNGIENLQTGKCCTI